MTSSEKFEQIYMIAKTQGNTVGFTDSELEAWLQDRCARGMLVGYVYAKHLFRVFELSSTQSSLVAGDLGKGAVSALKKLSKSKLLKRIELSYETLQRSIVSDPSWTMIDAEIRDITTLKKERDMLFGQGRGKAISAQTAAHVWHDAGGRCMYRGCGSDLGNTPLTTKSARIAYLAHIVASDPDGPRGNSDSHALSDDPENIMLMCDGHHRLIDRIDVIGHPESLLKIMRKDHSDRVRLLLAGLQYPSAQIITLLADLGQVPTAVSKTELCRSILSRGFGPLSEVKHMIRRTQRDDRGRAGFWCHFLFEHESDIRELITYTSNRPSMAAELTPDVLAVFPLHLVPVLILSGRILGEARNVEVFQYNRNRQTWLWDEDTTKGTASSFDITYELVGTGNIKETILTLELTANLDLDYIPEELSNKVSRREIGWIRITCSNPNPNCIGSQESLGSFSDLARQAISTIQDNWRSQKVHVFGVSPASTLFKFGQMLQAGHHSVYTIYDRPDGARSFIPALELTGNEIRSIGQENEQTHSISLR